jgi:hypothetical protein
VHGRGRALARSCVSIDRLPPPDDSGTDALQRFSYQAHVAFQFCLRCAVMGDIAAIIPEHFEDLAIELDAKWRMTQIKTRDPERGPWELTDLLSSSGGAFRSVLRSHRALAEAGVDKQVEYEVRLEGAIKRGDPAEEFTVGSGGLTQPTRERCATRLGLTESEKGELLDNITVRPRQASRETIVASNLRLLGIAGRHLSHEALEEMYRRVVARIEQAMKAELLEQEWPSVLFEPDNADAALAARVEAKRLDKGILVPLFEGLGEPESPILRRISDIDALRATALEEKLTAAGASSAVLNDAKQLRANAAHKEAELTAAALLPNDTLLEDLHERLRFMGRAVVAGLGESPTPADAVWAGVMAQLPLQAAMLDPNRLFNADPMLLMGQLCQVSDLCRFDWGIGNE